MIDITTIAQVFPIASLGLLVLNTPDSNMAVIGITVTSVLTFAGTVISRRYEQKKAEQQRQWDKEDETQRRAEERQERLDAALAVKAELIKQTGKVSDKTSQILSALADTKQTVDSMHKGVEAVSLAADKSIWESDSDGQVLKVNSIIQNWTGYREDELLGGEWAKIIPEFELSAVQVAWKNATDGLEPFDMKYHFKHKDGSIFPVHSKCYPVKDPVTNKISGYVGVTTRLDGLG